MPYAVIVGERQLMAGSFDGDLFHDNLDGFALGFEKVCVCVRVGVEEAGGDDRWKRTTDWCGFGV